MPRELKKRGRREEKKRKAQDAVEPESPKRQRTDDLDQEPAAFEVHGDAGDDFIRFGGDESHKGQQQPLPQHEFYGLLEEDEQSYYANVNSKLVANDFESDEDRTLFVEAVHRETQGKEMKVASSQSCSRYLEKVILLSTPDQLKSLFSAFLENITYLVQHRFGSHCCEALFLEACRYVQAGRNTDAEETTLESLFVSAAEELKPNLGFLVTDRFATHAVRVLLLVLSGEEIDESTNKVVASRKKEKLDLPSQAEARQHAKRKVPASFKKAQNELIAAAFSGLDTTYVRALATHPTGNPFLQLVLRLELSNHKSNDKAHNTLTSRLFPDEELEPDSDGGKFIQGLMYDPTGSHLVEILIQHLPGKLFKKLYGNILKDRMQNLAKNDIASYIAMKVLERLGKDDLEETLVKILPEVPALIDRSRLGLLKTMFERCTVRQADSSRLVQAIVDAYGGDNTTLLPKMLRSNTNHKAPTSQAKDASHPATRADLHGSLLAQAMLQNDNACSVVEDSLLAQSQAILVELAEDPVSSRALQVALKTPNQSQRFRRQIVPRFYGVISELAQDSAGSHVVDALWEATHGVHFMKEKIAIEMLANEAILRESTYGRTVWRNWSMDTYQRRRGDWHAMAKHSKPDKQAEEAGEDVARQSGKSAIQLARERHAKNKSRSNMEGVRPASLTAEG